jgi:hypothetical protein
LLLWQRGYKAAFPYAWQHSFWDIWNDFDDNYTGQEMYREHCFTYPAADKPIDTVQWEGFAAGIIDRRYLATLQAAITAARELNINTLGIEAWIYNLKFMDLTTTDLDDVRHQIITYILKLKEQFSSIIEGGTLNTQPYVIIDGGGSSTEYNLIIDGA